MDTGDRTDLQPIIGAEWVALLSLPVGSNDAEVAYDLDVQGGAPRGPEAVTGGADGTVYVLDSLQNRVHVFGGKYRGTVQLPSKHYPRDLVATAEGLCGPPPEPAEGNEVTELSPEGDVVRTWRLPEDTKSEDTPRLARTIDEKAILWSASYDELAIDELQSGPIEAPTEEPVIEKEDGQSEAPHDRLVRRERAGRGIAAPDGRRWMTEFTEMETGQLVTDDGKTTIPITVHGVFGSVRLIAIDQSGQLYVLVEDLFSDGSRLGVELTIQCYHPEGKLTGVARLPLEEFVVLPNRPVEVLADGTVYALVPRRDAASVYQVQLEQDYVSRIGTSSKGALAEDEFWADESEEGVIERQITPSDTSAINIVSRKTAYDNAHNMATCLFLWYPKYDYFHYPEPNGTPRPGDAVKPVQLQGLGMWGKSWGIPYTWGGFDSFWSRSDHMPWRDWPHAQEIYGPGYSSASRGPLIGDVNTSCHPIAGVAPCYPSGAYGHMAGIDCSGFVAAAAGYIPATKPGTGTLAAVGFDHGKAIGGSNVVLNVQPMNYFVSGGHVLYYIARDVASGGMATLEATIDLNPQAAKKFVRSWSCIANWFPHHRA